MVNDDRYMNQKYFKTHNVSWENGRCVRRPKKVKSSASTTKAANTLTTMVMILVVTTLILILLDLVTRVQ
jgi:uncharacterized membrane protein YbaN (DUF454 family)